jgi:tetratricopeptide (TPR) repeat protein
VELLLAKIFYFRENRILANGTIRQAEEEREIQSMKRHLTSLFSMLAITAFAFAAIGVSYAGAEPQQAASAEEQESSPEYIEQYEAWEKAKDEPDLQKSATMLIQFLEKYPKSELRKHAEGSYLNVLIKCSESKKYQDLETLAEQWLKLRPGDLQTIGFIVSAARELGHNDKWTQNLVEIYKMQPTGNLANEIAQVFNKTGNKAKYLEWTDTALKSSEFETDFKTRLELVQFYVGEKNPPKALEYARAALKAADLVKEPAVETKQQLIKVRKACLDTIGKILLEQDQFEDAIKAFQQAHSLEKSGESCYFIAYCLRMQKNVDDAMIWYAKAEQNGGEFAPKAKENLEQLYKALHNNTLIGIEKIYRKAQSQTDTAEARLR